MVNLEYVDIIFLSRDKFIMEHVQGGLDVLTPSYCPLKILHYNYLCTYDLYGPVRKIFDLGR